MRWLWAAYRSGMWRDVFDSGLSQMAFVERIMDFIGAAEMDWIIDARGHEGIRPVGLVMGNWIMPGRILHPHVDWFPWATPRNKMEGIAAFLRETSKRYKLFVYAADEAIPFYTRMTQYRILRRGCKVLDHFSMREHSMFFYTVGP